MRSNWNPSQIIDEIDTCLKNKKQPMILILIGFIIGIIVFGVGIYLSLSDPNNVNRTIIMDPNNQVQNSTQATASRLFLISFVIIIGFGMIGFFLHIKQRNNFQDLSYKTNLFLKKHNYFFKITKYHTKQLIIAKALIKEIQESSINQDVK
ncbi:hypothetical protein H3143_02145 [Mycoplasma tullyi]|uniref:Transmembrane protein n=1 Tax=Mycoplasma tullyi TaxID=1612150 RepID=A0A7D7U8Q5_9MOLU|nr:hypothetical protein [Mycoplasma tullyi]QMT98287.1 hypothetical protein H3143_02145 [Mycoplasma tullyi]